MHTEALRLTRLVDDLGKLAEAQQPGLTMAKRPVDMGEVVDERAEVHRERFDAKGVALEQRTERASSTADGGRLVQIIDNLLSNALRYTDPGGTVTVAVEAGGRSRYRRRRHRDRHRRRGPAPHLRALLARRAVARAHTGGAGIGLAIVRELVRAHDGRIDVESTPGEGSRFRVVLPVAHRSPRTPERSQAHELATRPVMEGPNGVGTPFTASSRQTPTLAA